MSAVPSLVDKFQLLVQAAEDEQIVGATLSILVSLANMANNQSGECWPSYRTLASKASVSEKQVQRAVKKLEERGYINVTGAGIEKKSNVYRLNKPWTPMSIDTDVHHGHQCPPPIDTDVHLGQTPVSTKSVKRISVNESVNKESLESMSCDRVLELFSEHCSQMPSPQKITSERKRAIRKLFKELDGDFVTMEKLFREAGNSRFLNGENERGWRANFNWLLKPQNAIKVLEGNYKNKTEEKGVIHNVLPIPDGLKTPASW